MSEISIYQATIAQYDKILGHLDEFLVKAAGFADRKKFDVNLLFQDRLAPDMLPLGKQIHIACDSAKFSAAFLTGTAAPKFEDNETTYAEFRTRIKNTRDFLKSVKPESYKTDLRAKVELPRYAGKYMTAEEYVLQYNQPNFYFHVTMAYALLRKSGVELGKMDFLGELPLKPV